MPRNYPLEIKLERIPRGRLGFTGGAVLLTPEFLLFLEVFQMFSVGLVSLCLDASAHDSTFSCNKVLSSATGIGTMQEKLQNRLRFRMKFCWTSVNKRSWKLHRWRWGSVRFGITILLTSTYTNCYEHGIGQKTISFIVVHSIIPCNIDVTTFQSEKLLSRGKVNVSTLALNFINF